MAKTASAPTELSNFTCFSINMSFFPCNSLTGIDKTCDGNRGSVTQILVVDQLSVTATTATSAHTISAITLSGNAQMVEIKFNRNAGNYDETLARVEVSGARIYDQKVSVTIPRRDIDKRNSIMLMGEGDREIALILRDGNDIYWYFPNMILSDIGGGSGAARKDGSTFTLGFTNESLSLAVDVDPSIIANLY